MEIVLIPIICGVLVRAALPMTVSKLDPWRGSGLPLHGMQQAEAAELAALHVPCERQVLRLSAW